MAQSTGDGIFVLFGAPVAHEEMPVFLALASRLRLHGRRFQTLSLEPRPNLPVAAQSLLVASLFGHRYAARSRCNNRPEGNSMLGREYKHPFRILLSYACFPP